MILEFRIVGKLHAMKQNVTDKFHWMSMLNIMLLSFARYIVSHHNTKGIEKVYNIP